MSVEVTVKYLGESHCVATHGPSGATLETDAPLDNGGRGSAFSPTDLVATALGTCVLTIIGMVAERHQLELAGCTVRVTKQMVSTPHRRIDRLETLVTIPADQIPDAALRTKLEAAARHCPVHQSLRAEIEAPIEFCYA